MAIQTPEILVIVVAVVLLFGAAAIPKLARSLGRAQGEFKKAKSEFDQQRVAGEKEAAEAGASEQQIRQAAKDVGIDEASMSLDEVKRALNEKLG